jgi:hypothetical protein
MITGRKPRVLEGWRPELDPAGRAVLVGLLDGVEHRTAPVRRPLDSRRTLIETVDRSLYHLGTPDVSYALTRAWLEEAAQARNRDEAARIAFDRVRRGEQPTAEELERAPLLRHWRLEPSDGRWLMLSGIVQGHPRLPDGPARTSVLLGVAQDLSWARTYSRWYRLADCAQIMTAHQLLALQARLAALRWPPTPD